MNTLIIISLIISSLMLIGIIRIILLQKVGIIIKHTIFQLGTLLFNSMILLFIIIILIKLL